MSRRRLSTRGRGRSGIRRHQGLGRAGALVAFLVLAALLGGIANVAPVPEGVIGFAVVVVGILCWVGSGSRGRH